MSTTPQPFLDHARPILDSDPALSDEHRADLWDIFHSSKNADELAHHLQPLSVSDATKQALHEAKQKNTPEPAPADHIVNALTRLSTMDPKILELAESHPNILKTIVSAVTAGHKAAGKASSASKSEGKGKTPSDAGSASSVAPDATATPHVVVVAPQVTPNSADAAPAPPPPPAA